MKEKVKVFSNTTELNHFAAERFVSIASESIADHGRFTIALAGGSTPKSLYQLLASDKFKDKVDWSRSFFFFGDERNVLPLEPKSNFRMANENLFEPLKIKDENIFRWQTELKDPEIISENYEETLRKFFIASDYPPATAGGSDHFNPPTTEDGSDDLPRFDLILLGMGTDGHTASLFPFTEAVRTLSGSDGLNSHTEKIAVANPVEKLQTTRLSLTFPVINNAANVIFLVAGVEKAEVLREVLEGEFQPEKLPSQNVRPKNGRLYWMIDKNVAKLLRNNGN